MKKIKKILPVLLGVMVLMFGSLTVCAAETSNIDYESIAKKSGVLDKYPYYVMEVNNSHVVVRMSDVPFIYNTSAGHAFGLSQKGTLYLFDYYPSTDVIKDAKSISYNYDQWFLTNNGAGHPIQFSYSSHDIWFVGADKENDKPVFRGPAPLVAVAEVLPEVVRERTTVILTTAVVCLALLVILSVLPKKLPRFLNR